MNGLLARTTYYFALIARDEVDNASGLSNVASGSTWALPPPRVRQWGGSGAGSGQFGDFSPSGIAVDRARHILYAADPDNRRVEKFDLEGNFLGAFPAFAERGQVGNPNSMAADPDGHIYVVEEASTGDHSDIVRYDAIGTESLRVPWYPLCGGQRPLVACDDVGDVYMPRERACDEIWIERYDRSGVLTLAWRLNPVGKALPIVYGMAIDADGVVSVLIPDWWVLRFNREGSLLESWDLRWLSGGTDLIGPYGSPHELSIDSDGTHYIALNSDVLTLSAAGEYLGTFGEGLGATGLAGDTEHHLYVADVLHHGIVEFGGQSLSGLASRQQWLTNSPGGVRRARPAAPFPILKAR